MRFCVGRENIWRRRQLHFADWSLLMPMALTTFPLRACPDNSSGERSVGLCTESGVVLRGCQLAGYLETLLAPNADDRTDFR
jgi:hypothetical protein